MQIYINIYNIYICAWQFQISLYFYPKPFEHNSLFDECFLSGWQPQLPPCLNSPTSGQHSRIHSLQPSCFWGQGTAVFFVILILFTMGCITRISSFGEYIWDWPFLIAGMSGNGGNWSDHWSGSGLSSTCFAPIYSTYISGWNKPLNWS